MAIRANLAGVTFRRAALSGLMALAMASPAAWAQEEAPAAQAPGITGGDLIGYGSIHHPTIGRGGMVVSQNKVAARIGAEILRKGGNAVDATVAVAIAETLTLPRAGNIGGGGYMLVYNAKDKSTTAIEYYGQAPLGVTPDLLLGADGKFDRSKVLSFKGVTVPGTIAGLYEAHKRFGKLPWAKLIQPTIDLAAKGIVMSDDESIALAARKAQMAKDPSGAAARLYFKKDGSAYQPGEVFKNPDLVWTLKQIQARGADGFYKGPVAEKIVAAMKANGGIISMEDLASYRANVLPPIWSSYRGYSIAYMPPTSAASSVAEAMNIIEQFPMASYGQGNVASMHLIAEALKIVTVDRRYSGGPPQWHTPAKGLASKDFAKERAKLISMDRSLDGKTLPPLDPGPYESRDTTHLAVADKDGNVVSNTYTLSDSFGAHVVAPGTGFLLNNSLGNFDWGSRSSVGNKIEPGKRAQSTISPLIVFKDGKPWIATGTPGGGTILATMVQMLVNLIDFNLNIAEAAERPRVYQSGADGPLQLEESIPEDLVAGLKAKGHKVERSQIIGSTQSIMIGPDGVFYGAADTRRPDAEAAPVR
jgi:gamma-glutamyltranspeptidase/glutathione hydrolase